jgi:hypothetical protein
VLDTSTRITTKDPGAPAWYRVFDEDHAFTIVDARQVSICQARIEWNANMTPALFGATNACADCAILALGAPGEVTQWFGR